MFGKKLVCFSADLVSLQQLVLLLRQKLGAFSTYHQMAIVFDPPSNVRQSPNGDFLCSIQERTTINIQGLTGDWYYTDVFGKMGVIHSSQITFQPN